MDHWLSLEDGAEQLVWPFDQSLGEQFLDLPIDGQDPVAIHPLSLHDIVETVVEDEPILRPPRVRPAPRVGGVQRPDPEAAAAEGVHEAPSARRQRV